MNNKRKLILWGMCIVIWLYIGGYLLIVKNFNVGISIIALFNVFLSIYSFFIEGSDMGIRRVFKKILQFILLIFILFFIIGEGMILNGIIRNKDNDSKNILVLLQNEKLDKNETNKFVDMLNSNIEKYDKVVVTYNDFEQVKVIQILDKFNSHNNKRKLVESDGNLIEIFKEIKKNSINYYNKEVNEIKVFTRRLDSFRVKMVGKEVGVNVYTQGIKGRILTMPVDHIQEMVLILRTVTNQILPYIRYR